MIHVYNYEVINGERTEKIPYEKVLKDKKELEDLRKQEPGGVVVFIKTK